ncbi:MAG: translocation/assembly module TamB domain-containing protein [Candidatus Aminicenantes bacterium]|jgi:hypothetical protein
MKINKRVRSLIILSIIILFFLGAGVFIKNIFLSQIKNEIDASFFYDHLHMSFFPPVLVIENVKTRIPAPYFSAKKISLRISYGALLTRQKPFNVVIEEPVLIISETSQKGDAGTKEGFALSFPILVEEGLIKNGEFYFQGRDTSFQSRGIEAIFTQKRNEFSLEAKTERSLFYPGPSKPRVEGKLDFLIEERGQKIYVKRLKVDSTDFSFESEGSLIDLTNPQLDLEISFRANAPWLIELLHLPFDWEGNTEGQGTFIRNEEGVSLKADFSSSNLFLNDVFMGEIRGRIDYREDAQTVEFNYQKDSLPREYVKLRFTEEKVEGILRGAFLDPVTEYFALPWPISTPAWGEFSVDDEKLETDLEFRDEYTLSEPERYPFRGPLQLHWDKKKTVTFSSPSFTSDFGEFDVDGTINVGTDLDITIQGDVGDLNRTRDFMSVLLSKDYAFADIRGRGDVDLHVFGEYYDPQVHSRFSFSPGSFGKFEADSVEGEAEIIKGDFFARFNVDDTDMKGRVGLFSGVDGVRVDIHMVRGFVERIFPALDFEFPLEGEASGNFEVKLKGESIQVKGDFASPLMNFVGQDVKELRGKMEWKENFLSLSELHFQMHEGAVKGDITLGLVNREFDINILGEGIDFSSLYSGMTGNLSFLLNGKGFFGKDYALGPFEIVNLYHSPFQKTTARGLARFNQAEGKLDLDLMGNFSPGQNLFNVSFSIPLNEDMLSVGVRGSFTDLDLLLPWADGVEGRVNYLGEVKGPLSSLKVKGAVDFKGPVFPLPGFAHAFRDYSGLMFVENSLLTFRSLQATLGGGDVQGAGELKLGEGGIELIDVKLEGTNMTISPGERTRVLADGMLNLFKGPDQFVLKGDFFAHRLSWRREVNEEFIFYSTPYYEAEREPTFFDDLTLDIRLRADDNAWIENSLGRVRTRFDLTVGGSVSEPVILGDIVALDGDINFQDRQFKLLVGRVNFVNPVSTEPYISFMGETYVKDFRVTFSLEGLLDNLNPEFTSSPPLPPEDVLALLALGEAFRRTYSYDTSTQVSTASLISFQLSEEAKKRAEGLFTLDRFRIDPFIMGSSAEMAARLTVGKKVSKNFFILYSTNLTTQREEIIKMEWELTDDISLIGTRDEEGRISFDVKIRKRF